MTSLLSITKAIAGSLALSFVCFTISCEAKTHAAAKPSRLTKHERAELAVERLSFGPRPGDVERVEKMGVERWISQQLHPETIDDSPLEAKLDALPAMRLSTEQLIWRYPPAPMIRQVDAGRFGLPGDPVERAIYANALANYRERKEAKTADPADASGAKPALQKQAVADSELNHSINVVSLLRMPADARWKSVLAMQPGTVRPFVQGLTPAERQQLVAGMTPQQKEVLLALVEPNRVVAEEMQQEKLLRAVYSNRQLEEVMTNFWSNHFNIYLRKNGEMPWYLATYERDVIRPHAMGKFEDLLIAVAHSPAMLVYLDNQQSIGPHSIAAMRANARQNANSGQKKSSPGLNENYARELMELHTVGVNGGYSQQDVVELAKVLTGWGVENPQQGYGFQFNERRHEPGTKVVMGHTIRENGTGEHGEAEGMEALHILANSPATARFLSTKLAMEFASDTPPKPLVDRMTKTYLKTHGDIRQVLSTMFRSPEFWSRDAYRAKLKTPLEFVVSSLRATDADVENATAVAAALDRLGMPLYGVQQPNGYSLKADPWLGAEALLARMNFALALTANRVPGVTVAIAPSAGTAEQDEQRLEAVLLDGQVSPHTREVVLKQMESTPSTQTAPVAAAAFKKGRPGNRGDLFVAAPRSAPVSQSTLAAALLLGSPDFQRR